MPPLIVRDTREDPAFDSFFSFHGAQIEVKQLLIGDFICSEKLVVERKTREDFESSIVDGRLFSQVPDLLASYQRVVLVVEGELNADRIHKNALLGAYATLVSDFGVALFFTRNKEKTAELIFHLAHHEQVSKKRPMGIFAKRKTNTPSETLRAVIETLPLMGPGYSKKLLAHFKSLAAIAEASEESLCEVIGPKRAKIVRNMFVYSYSDSDDEVQKI